MTLLHSATPQPNVDVNGLTRRGSSLLHLAAEIGDDDKVNFLLLHQVWAGRVRHSKAW